MRGEVVEQICGESEARSVAVKDGLVGEVFEQQGFTETVRAEQDDVGGIGDEAEREQRIDQGAVALGRPCPVEVGERFEGTESCVVETPFAMGRDEYGRQAAAFHQL